MAENPDLSSSDDHEVYELMAPVVLGHTPFSDVQNSGSPEHATSNTSSSEFKKTKSHSKEKMLKIGPKPPKKKSTVGELKAKAMEKFRRRKSSSKSDGSTSSSVFVPEEVTENVEEERGDEMSVQEFAIKYSDQLPVQVYVSKGVYGMEDKYSLSTEDVCNIHFVRHRELVKVEDKDRKLELSVPVNSVIKFGIVYNPENNENEAMKGYLFPSVSDLLGLGYSKLPKIVCANQFHDPERPGAEPVREVMAIKEVILPDNPDEFRKLRVFSITTLKERVLAEDVYGHFSTRPSFMQLYLTEILKYVSNPIPCQIAMFRDPLKNIAPGVPSSMFRRILQMKKQITDVILIATSVLDQVPVEAAEPFEIPTEIDVDFQVVKLSEEKRQELEEDTAYLANNMDEDRVRHYRYVNVSEEVHRLQSSIYLAVRGRNQSQEDPDYLHPITGNRLSVDKRVDLAEKGLKKANDDIERLRCDLQRQEGNTDYVKSWCQAIEDKFTKQLHKARADIDSLKAEVTELRTCYEHEQQQSTVSQSKSTTYSSQGNGSNTSEHNRKLLESMDVKQIVSLLKSTGLSDYVDVFNTESIDGAIFQELDEGILENELGVKSRLHQIKMMQLIKGKLPTTNTTIGPPQQ